MKYLNKWFETPFYKITMNELNEILQEPASYRILKKQKEEIFLL